MSLIYAVYDFSADTWYCLGAYEHVLQVREYYKALASAPFWRGRASALYIVGQFDPNTGTVASAPRVRCMESGLETDFHTDDSLAPEANSEGAGGEEPPEEPAENVDSRNLYPDLAFGEDVQD